MRRTISTMGLLSWLRGDDVDRFSMSIGDPAFAAWWFGSDNTHQESVTASTVLGLSAVNRACSIISTTIASLPLRTYEKQGDQRTKVESVFDDPYPGIDGMTRFAWTESILLHLLLWRNAYLWHEKVDGQGFVAAYKPLHPDVITKVEVKNGRKRFTYRDADNQEQEVGTESITHIPGPSIDTVAGYNLLYLARSVLSGAISGDKTAATTLRRGIRLAGLVTPADNEEDVTPTEAATILESLRASVVGRENAGDVAVINKRMKLQPWTPNNIESQWHETRQMMLGEVGRLFGIPPHLLGDIEKQTSWGTGVAEQNVGLARYTLMGWTSRIEEVLTRRLPRGQFVEFDYKGLLQGTPAQEVELLIAQVEAGLLTEDEARRILNYPPLTPAQKAERSLRRMPAVVTDPQEAA